VTGSSQSPSVHGSSEGLGDGTGDGAAASVVVTGGVTLAVGAAGVSAEFEPQERESRAAAQSQAAGRTGMGELLG
jgi:hypothetical protein